MKTKYRVKYSRNLGGYIAQKKYWFIPFFWIMIGHYSYGSKESAIHQVNLSKYKIYL